MSLPIKLEPDGAATSSKALTASFSDIEFVLFIPRLLGKVGDIYDKPRPIYAPLIVASTLYGLGKVLDNPKMVETTNLMAQSMIITGIFTTTFKIIIGRARPYANSGPHDYRPFSFESKYMSMPSGHTSSAFALMTVIAKQYDSWYIKIPAYTFAVCVGFQRMNANKHWGSDLIIGGTLGYIIGTAVTNRYKNKGGDHTTVQPAISQNGIGLIVTF